jgi:LPS sulfotransferase NodH
MNYFKKKNFLIENKFLVIKRTFFITLSLITRKIENIFFFFINTKSFSNKKILIIIGTPRCGSTLIYQFLARATKSEYYSNLHQLLPQLTTYLLQKIKKKPKLDEKLINIYGHTENLFDVNEANEMINFWFKTKKIKEIRKRFYKTMQYFKHGKTNLIIIKNLSLYDKIYKLHKAVPEIIFLHISRNQQSIIESVVRAYLDLGYFNFPPNEFKNKKYNIIKYATEYIKSISRIITNQLYKINNKNIIYFSYEKFCKNPYDLVTKLRHKIIFDLKNKNLKLKIRQSVRKKISREDQVRLEKILK